MMKALIKKPIDRLKAIISQDSVQEQFRNAMGKHKDLFVASLIDVFNGGLRDCDPGLVVQEALKAAVLKLPISKGLGFAYIIPYNKSYQENGQWKKKKVPQFQIGYKGLGQLAMRSGQLKILNSDVVYEGEFKGKNRLTGQIDLTGKRKSDKVVGYFVYMELINGFQKMEYWTKEEVQAHAEQYSEAYQNDLRYEKQKSAWSTNFDAMAKKTVMKAVLGKYAPLSVEFLMELSYDRADEPQDMEPKDITPPKTPPVSKPPKADNSNIPENQDSYEPPVSENIDALQEMLVQDEYMALVEKIKARDPNFAAELAAAEKDDSTAAAMIERLENSI